MSPATKLDAACASAVDVARAALLEVVPAEQVGEHLGATAEGERLATHTFACQHPGYVGWNWAVTVARVPRGRVVTVSESTLLPAEGALLAPAWVPWHQRLLPGDVGPGDLLPVHHADERLAPGYTATDIVDPGIAFDTAFVVSELGLGRARVLSPEGRDQAADRWFSGDGGPGSDTARTAPYACLTCGFLVPLAGSLGAAFGVCSNEMSRSDGRVVSFKHGCGGHSDITDESAAAPLPDHVFDTMTSDSLHLQPNQPTEASAEAAEGTELAETAEPAEPSEPRGVTETTEAVELLEPTESKPEPVESESGESVETSGFTVAP